MMNKIIHNLKVLCLDIIQKANSGHPGMALGVAECLFILFTKHLNINPNEPDHFQRDRFILSNGHGCAILYVLLYLLGYDYSLDDLMNFRQLYSKTPGHPEYNPKLGIDASTGPLGQGIANGVGQAISSKKLNLKNKIVVMCGDGYLMEGISYESTSLAGHLNLNNLILIYDDNKITIDGSTDLTFSEDIIMRFKSIKWNVIEIDNGNENLELIDNTFKTLFTLQERPTLIILKTKIAYGSVLEGKSKSHGAPLGEENIQIFKEKYGFDKEKYFEIMEETITHFKSVKNEKLNTFHTKNIKNYEIPKLDCQELIQNINDIEINKNAYATRELSGMFLKELAKQTRNIIIGSADLAASNKTMISNENITSSDFSKIYLNYGIREHAMVGIANGISTYGILPIVSTFLVFVSYCYGALRLSAINKHKVLFVFTHDSFYVGEDGPTHQPVECLSLLRSIPNLYVFRPADKNELIGCYHEALKYDGPSCMILSRQNLPMYDFTKKDKVCNGGYFVYKSSEKPDIVIIATGSELSMAIEVATNFKNANVFSVPCLELFDKQSDEYKHTLNINGAKIISIEANGIKDFCKYTNYSIGIEDFGHSSPANDLKKHFKFTKDDIIEIIMKKENSK